MRKYVYALLLACGIASLPAHADVAGAKALADKYAAIAKNINPDFKGLSAEAGRAFYIKELTLHGKTGKVSCASCHTDNPAAEGKHAETGKKIKSLAPAVESQRFSSIDKVEKNFEKHCMDILGRDCTAQEKGDYITYLLTIKKK